jgi:beta propeller repeat protein
MNRKFLAALSLAGLAACQDVTDPAVTALSEPPQFAVGSGTPTQITSHVSSQILPSISGDRVVWLDSRLGNFWDIYSYDIAQEQESPLVTGLGQLEQVGISGNHVVFVRLGGFAHYTVFAHDLSTGATTPISNDLAFRLHTDISGDRVVWQELVKNGTVDEWQIMVHELTTGQTTRVTALGLNRFFPAIGGEWVVWTDLRDGWWNIFAYNLTTNSTSTKQNLNVEGGRVVWEDISGRDKNVLMADIATGTVTNIATGPEWQANPNIFGDYVVYAEAPSNGGGHDIRLFDLAEGVDAPITDDDGGHFWPAVDGNRIVWVSASTGNADIFMFELEPEIDDILDVVDEAIGDGSIDNQGIGNALTKKLENALAALDAGDVATARDLLNAFIAQVSAQSGKHIDAATADELIQLAEAVLATLR